jgi:hypothetical protein
MAVARCDGTEVIDEQVARDRHQPRAHARLLWVIATPRAQRASEGALGEILGLAAVAQPVGEEAIHLEAMVVVHGCAVGRGKRWRGAANISMVARV